MKFRGWSIFVYVLLFISCSKSENVPSTAQTNAAFLAGTSGNSKTWNLTSATASINGGVPQPITNFPGCELDNIFKFSNDVFQSYVQTEGGTKCMSTDSTLVEQGNWGFTNDGKNLLIDAFVYASGSQFQSEPDLAFFILSQGEPLKIVQMTSTSFTLSYPYTDTSTDPATNYLFTITFTKI